MREYTSNPVLRNFLVPRGYEICQKHVLYHESLGNFDLMKLIWLGFFILIRSTRDDKVARRKLSQRTFELDFFLVQAQINLRTSVFMAWTTEQQNTRFASSTSRFR